MHVAVVTKMFTDILLDLLPSVYFSLFPVSSCVWVYELCTAAPMIRLSVTVGAC